MKLTWFGGTAVRVHAGGLIVVIDPETATAPVRQAELVSGADRVINSGDATLPLLDVEAWRPQRRGRLLDEAEQPPVQLFRFGASSLLIAAPGEPQLALVGRGDALPDGRWAEGAVTVLFGVPPIASDYTWLDLLRPRLLALAMPDDRLEAALETLHPQLSGGEIGLVTLEPEMAVEL